MKKLLSLALTLCMLLSMFGAIPSNAAEESSTEYAAEGAEEEAVVPLPTMTATPLPPATPLPTTTPNFDEIISAGGLIDAELGSIVAESAIEWEVLSFRLETSATEINYGELILFTVTVTSTCPVRGRLLLDVGVSMSGEKNFDLAPTGVLPTVTSTYYFASTELLEGTQRVTLEWDISDAPDNLRIGLPAEIDVTVNPAQGKPNIVGPSGLTLPYGYTATSSDSFTIADGNAVTILCLEETEDNITWNAGTNRIDIAEGLLPGPYWVRMFYGAEGEVPVVPVDTTWLNESMVADTFVLVVTKATPSLTMSASPASSAMYGASVTFTATLPDEATGTVQFSDNGKDMGSAVMVSDGVATYTTTSLSAGVHSMKAVYSGDTTYEEATSSMKFTINKRSLGFVVTADPETTAAYGTSVTFTATLDSRFVDPAMISGSVTFRDDESVLGIVTVSNGTAAFTTSALGLGQHTITAEYSGDSNFNARDPVALSYEITGTCPRIMGVNMTLKYGYAATSSEVLTITGNPAPTLTLITSTDKIVWNDSKKAFDIAPGLPVGTYYVMMTGKNGVLPSASFTFTLTVTKITPTVLLTGPQSELGLGDEATFTATLPEGATGLVQFKDGNNALGAARQISNGKASYSTWDLTAGTHIITAHYGGDSNCNSAASNALVQTVYAPDVTVDPESYTGSGVYGSISTAWYEYLINDIGVVQVPYMDVNYTKSYSKNSDTDESGPITQFFECGSVGSGGENEYGAVYELELRPKSSLPVGHYEAYVEIVGTNWDNVQVFSKGVYLYYTVTKATTSIGLTASYGTSAAFGTPVTFAARVNTKATGTVQFSWKSTNLGSPVEIDNGYARLTTANLAPGVGYIEASYSGDANYEPVSKSISFTVTGTAPTITGPEEMTLEYGYEATSSEELTITGNPAPTVVTGGNDKITWNYDTNSLDIAAGLPVGTYHVVLYATNLWSSANFTFTLTVEKATPTITVTASPANSAAYGTNVAFTAALSPAAYFKEGGGGGTVQFKVDGVLVGSAADASSGSLYYETSTLAVGWHAITAVYSGDANYEPMSQSISFEITGTAPTITGRNSMTLEYGYAPTNNGVMVVKGNPTPTVTCDANPGQMRWNAGMNSLQIASGLAIGTYPVTLTASNGVGSDATFTFTLTVTKATPTITVTASPANSAAYGTNVTFTATVSAGSGTIQFRVDGVRVGYAADASSGSFYYDTATLAVGTHTITAEYSGDKNYNAAIGSLSYEITGTEPGITGPEEMTLEYGYEATSSEVFTITGNPAPTVEFYSDIEEITWNDTTKTIDIAAGLAVGTYSVKLTASNGVGTNATLTFTLTVTAEDEEDESIEFTYERDVQKTATGIIGRVTVDMTAYPDLLTEYALVCDIAGSEVYYSAVRTNNAANTGKYVFPVFAPYGSGLSAANFSFVKIEGAVAANAKIVYGNVDGDGKGRVNIDDWIALEPVIDTGDWTSINLLASDLNGDGRVNMSDWLILEERIEDEKIILPIEEM
jgi:hypothetical protein